MEKTNKMTPFRLRSIAALYKESS